MQRYLLAATIDAALTRGRAYFQIDRNQGCDGSAQRVDSDQREAAEGIQPELWVAATTTPLNLTEFSRIPVVVGNLQDEITTLQRAQTTSRPNRPRSRHPDEDIQLEPRVACVDKSGRPLVKEVQVVRDSMVPGTSRPRSSAESTAERYLS